MRIVRYQLLSSGRRALYHTRDLVYPLSSLQVQYTSGNLLKRSNNPRLNPLTRRLSSVPEMAPPDINFKELPPPIDYVLNRESFTKVVQCTAIRIPAKKAGSYMKDFNQLLINSTWPRLKPVLRCQDDDSKRLLVLADFDALSDDLKSKIDQDDQVELIRDHSYPIPYEYFGADEILKQILPEGAEVPSAFETIGHIAHLNIRHDLMGYRYIIGQVLLDKNPKLKTVLTKVGSIENEFRVFDHVILAGEDEMKTVVVQGGFRFHLDFSQVYWNSRLEGEHNRLASKYFKPGQVLCDMMCGIGPFALRAAANGCDVYANDLNPRSVHWLKENIVKNKARLKGKIHPFNTCGRMFVRCLAGAQSPLGDASLKEAIPPLPQYGVHFDHICMNLPASSVEFVDAFRECFPEQIFKGRMPRVHLHTFLRGTEEEAVANARKHVEDHLGGLLEEEPEEVHVVRCVAPNKHMLCITFRVPESIGLIKREEKEDEEEEEEDGQRKKRKVKKDDP